MSESKKIKQKDISNLTEEKEEEEVENKDEINLNEEDINEDYINKNELTVEELKEKIRSSVLEYYI